MGRGQNRGAWRGRGKGRGRGTFYQNRARRDHSKTDNHQTQDSNQSIEKICPIRDSVGLRLAEVDVGIAEYISKHNGFSGAIKERYSDFQVNEITLDGSVVKLTTFYPSRPEDKVLTDEDPNSQSDVALTPVNLIPISIWDKLKVLVDTKSSLSTYQEKKGFPKEGGEDSKEENQAPKENKEESKKLTEVPDKETITPMEEKEVPNEDKEESEKGTVVAEEETEFPKEDKEVSEKETEAPGEGIEVKRKEEENPNSQLKTNEEIVEDTLSDLQSSSAKFATENEADDKSECDAVELEVTELDKESRRLIHTTIKGAFGDVNSNTIDRDGKKYIVIKLGKDKRKGHREGKYLYFVVHKRNMDTSETILRISDQLKLNPSMITCAGTKDKRAITSQLMCLRGGDPDRLFRISNRLRGISLGNYSFKDKPLHLGDLKGNQFRIALRNVTGSNEDIEKAMLSLQQHGFINYFGLQRFGSNYAVPTYEIGKLFLQEKWEKAVETILRPREESTNNDFNNVSAACKEWHSNRDAKQAIKKLRYGSKTIEGSLLISLSKCQPNDYVGALSALARNVRSLYLHSYQSLIWNKIVSRRIREYGLQPIVGDLVLMDTSKTDSIDTESCILPLVDSHELEKGENVSTKQVARCITQEELPNISIEDVVLPLPGYDASYPNNIIKEWYLEFLKEDGLNFDSFRPKVQQYSLKGAYRYIISRPKDLSWSLVNYAKPNDDLILSDLDIMYEKELSFEQEGAAHKALLITMSLQPSCYATMALREVMKVDTSVSNQVKLASHDVKEPPEASIPQESSSQTVDAVINTNPINNESIHVDNEGAHGAHPEYTTDSKGSETVDDSNMKMDDSRKCDDDDTENKNKLKNIVTISSSPDAGSSYNLRRKARSSDENSPKKKKIKFENSPL